MYDEIKHFNKNHDSLGRFTFGKGGTIKVPKVKISRRQAKRIARAADNILDEFYDGGDKTLNAKLKVAQKNKKNIGRKYKGPAKNIRRKLDIKKNKKIDAAREDSKTLYEKYKHHKLSSVQEKIDDAIKKGDAKLISKYYSDMSMDQLREAKARLDLITQIDKVSEEQKSKQKRDWGKIEKALGTVTKAMDAYNKIQMANIKMKSDSDKKVDAVIDKVSDLPIDDYVPKHSKEYIKKKYGG